MRRLRIVDGDDMHYRHHEKKYMHDPELLEAFECGVKEGWREAMLEAERYGERNYGRGGGYGERGHRGGVDYRDDERWDDSEYEERRRRRANGRFY